MRKLKTRSGRKVRAKRICGEWCRLCINNLKRIIDKRKTYSKLAAKHGKRAATTKVKCELAADAKFRQRWADQIEEATHRLAGGSSRIRTSNIDVEHAREHIHDIVDRGLKFFTVARYIQKIGDPKTTKAKIVKRQLKSGKAIRGIYVRVEEEGEYDVEDRYRSRFTRRATKHRGGDALHEREASEAVSELEEEMDEADDYKGALSIQESKQRVADAVRAEEGKKVERSDQSAEGGDKVASGEASSSSSDVGGDESENSGVDSDSISPARKKKSSGSNAASRKNAALASPAAKSAKSVAASARGTATREEPGSARNASKKRTAPDMQPDTKALEHLGMTLREYVASYATGQLDALRGRPLSTWMKEVNEKKEAAKKELKLSREGAAKHELNKLVGQVDSILSLLRACSKTSPTFLEVAGARDTLRTAEGEGSDGHTKMLVLLHADHLIAHGNSGKALQLLGEDGPSMPTHSVARISSAAVRQEACTLALVKLMTAVFPDKLPNSQGVKQAGQEARTAMEPLLQHTMINTFSTEVQLHLKVISKTMAAAAMEADGDDGLEEVLRMCKKLAEGADGRKARSSLLGAFVLGKIGKQLIRHMSLQVERNTKDAVVTNKFKAILTCITAWPEDLRVGFIKEVKAALCDLEKHVGALPAASPLPHIVNTCLSKAEEWGFAAGARLAGLWVACLASTDNGHTIAKREDYGQAMTLFGALASWWAEFYCEIALKIHRAKEGSLKGKVNYGLFVEFAETFKYVVDNPGEMEGTEDQRIRIGQRIVKALGEPLQALKEVLAARLDGGQLAASLEARLQAALCKVSAGLGASVHAIEKELAINFEELLAVIDESGTLDTSTTSAVKIETAEDLKTPLDKAIGKISLLRSSDANHVLGRLRTMDAALPSIQSAIACEKMAMALAAALASARYDCERGFLQAVQTMLMGSRGLAAAVAAVLAETGNNDNAALESRFSRWKAAVIKCVEDIAVDSIAELQGLRTKIESKLIDLKPILANLDDESKLDLLINHAGHADLMRSLKSLQGLDGGGGFKRFDRVVGVLRCTGIFTNPSCDKANFAELRKEFDKLQNTGRTQMACRSAARVVKANDYTLIAVLEMEADRLKVTWPAAVRAKIDRMKAEAVGEAPEAEDETT